MMIILTIIFYVWLFAMLGFLWLIWRGSTAHIHRTEQTLLEVAIKSADAAKKAAEAAYLLAEQQGKGHVQ